MTLETTTLSPHKPLKAVTPAITLQDLQVSPDYRLNITSITIAHGIQRGGQTLNSCINLKLMLILTRTILT